MTVAAFFPILFDFYRNSLLSSFVDSGGGPNNIPDGIVPGKTFYMVLLCRQLCRSCPSVLTVNLSNLNHLNHKDFIVHSRLTEIFFWKLLPTHTGEMITDVSDSIETGCSGCVLSFCRTKIVSIEFSNRAQKFD